MTRWPSGEARARVGGDGGDRRRRPGRRPRSASGWPSHGGRRASTRDLVPVRRLTRRRRTATTRIRPRGPTVSDEAARRGSRRPSGRRRPAVATGLRGRRRARPSRMCPGVPSRTRRSGAGRPRPIAVGDGPVGEAPAALGRTAAPRRPDGGGGLRGPAARRGRRDDRAIATRRATDRRAEHGSHRRMSPPRTEPSPASR